MLLGAPQAPLGTTPTPSLPSEQRRYLKSQRTQPRKLTGDQRCETGTDKEINERFLGGIGKTDVAQKGGGNREVR